MQGVDQTEKTGGETQRGHSSWAVCSGGEALVVPCQGCASPRGRPLVHPAVLQPWCANSTFFSNVHTLSTLLCVHPCTDSKQCWTRTWLLSLTTCLP